MKTICIILFGFFLPYCCSSPVFGKVDTTEQSISSQKGSIHIVTTSDLHNLTSQWAAEYSRLHPKVNIRVINTDDKRSQKMLSAGTDIAFLSQDNDPALSSESIWKQVVGRDIIVPIVNAKNPFFNEISQQGISANEFVQFFEKPEMQNWGTLIENGRDVTANVYILNNESVTSSMADFLSINPEMINGHSVKTSAELISAIENDPYAIGLCRITEVLDISTQNINAHIKLLPIDKNQNGKIDYSEEIFDDYQSFSRGVWIGKYPRTLYHNIYTVSSKPPTQDPVVGFVKWIVTSGQEFLISNGYSDLLLSEQKTKIDAILISEIDAEVANTFSAGQKILALIIGIFLVIALVGNGVIWILNHRRSFVHVTRSLIPTVFDVNSVKVLNGLYFDKTHTWAFMEANGHVKIGIDDFLQHVTGTITKIKMKRTGERIQKGERILSIVQDGKQLNIYSPISGIIREQNPELANDSSILNSSPYEKGWVYMIKPTNWVREIQFFLMADKYREWLINEFSRLKDFLSVTIKTRTLEPARIILQDGGELMDCVLEDFGPEVWEDFQNSFIDINQ